MFARRRKPTYWDYSVNCTGNEAHLSSCKLGQSTSVKSNETCAGGLPVVVSCVPGRDFAPTPMTGFRKAFRHEVFWSETKIHTLFPTSISFYYCTPLIKTGNVPVFTQTWKRIFQNFPFTHWKDNCSCIMSHCNSSCLKWMSMNWKGKQPWYKK